MGKHKKKSREVLEELCTRLLRIEKQLYSDGDDGQSSRSRSTKRSRRDRYRSRSPCRRHRSLSSDYRSDTDTNHELEKKGGADNSELPQDELQSAEPSVEPSVEPPVEPSTSFEELLGEEGAPPACNSFQLHDSLATRWTAIIQSGLNQDTKSKIIKKYDSPSNCTLLVPPKLNEEIAAAINESGIKRDKRIVEQQVSLAAAITSIGKVLNNLIKSQEIENAQLVETLSDSARLLCDLYHSNCVTRRSLILPGLNKDMKELMEQTQISEHLFGDKLQDKVNAIKAVKKSGLELKNTPTIVKPPVKPSQKHLNYRGPQRSQVPRPSGQKPKARRPAYNPKTTQRSRRSPQNRHHRRQDRR